MNWINLEKYIYRLPTKLQEGNVFTHVCLFVQVERGPLCKTLALSPSPYKTPIPWTYSKLFNLDLLVHRPLSWACSNLFMSIMKHAQSARRWLASY